MIQWIGRWKASGGIQRQLILVNCGLIFAMVCVLAWLAYEGIDQRREGVMKGLIAGRSAFEEITERFGEANLQLARGLARLPSVRQALADGKQDMALECLTPMNEGFNQKAAFPIRIHLHDADFHSFLRVWKPEKNGDDLSGFRKTVIAAQREAHGVKGLEAGRAGLVLRGVAPVFAPGSETQVVGSLEVFCGLDKMLENMAQSGVAAALYEPENSVDATLRMVDHGQLGDFTILNPPPEENAPFVDEALLKKALQVPVNQTKGNWLIRAHPVTDWQGDPRAVYCQFVDFSDLVHKTRGEIMRLAAITLLLLGAGLFLAWWLSHGITRNLMVVVDQLDYAANALSDGSRRLAEDSQGLTRGVDDQSAETESIAASANQLIAMSQKSDERAGSALSNMEKTSHRIAEASQDIHRMREAMEMVGEATAKTSDFVATIDQMSFQTNLLALNAAVEAVRAGETGLGFAVVAEEVRNLANRSAKAARQSAELISEIRDRVEESTAILQETVDAFQDVETDGAASAASVNDVAMALKEQIQTIETIGASMKAMEKVAESARTRAGHLKAASAETADMSGQLKNLVHQLKQMAGRKVQTH